MEVPAVTYSSYFGAVSKVRWYRVSDYFNNYDVTLYIHTSNTIPSQAGIENRARFFGFEWFESIPANVTQQTLVRQISISHVPALKNREYVVINQAV